MIVIPKRKSYRLHATLLSLCLFISVIVVAAGAITTKALTAPSLFEGLRDRVQTDDKSGNTNQVKEDEKKNVNITETPVQTTKVQQPQTTVATPVQPKPVQAQTSTVQQATIQQQPTAATRVVRQPADTSGQSVQLAASQSVKPTSTVIYESEKISTSLRDNIYKGSLALVAVGLTIYIGSYVRTALRWISRTPAYTPRIITE